MAAYKHDIIIEQGVPFSLSFDLLDENGDLDQTAYTGAGKIRKHFNSTNAVSFTCVVNSGVFTLSMSAAVTANVVAGRYVYDTEIYSPDSGECLARPIAGIATVTPEVTR